MAGGLTVAELRWVASADTTGFDKGVDRADSRFSGFAGRLLKGAAGLAVGAGAGFAAFAASGVGAASDVSESASKVGVVFGRQAVQIIAASKTSAAAMGLSSGAYLAATGTLGNLLVSLDIAPKKAAGMSQQMVKLAGDLASFNNVSPEEALAAIQSGLTGETEPLKRFGVNMNDATLKAQAMKMGLIKATKDALTPQAKALAAQALIMAQTGTAQGDFARTSGGLANQQRILAARSEDLKAKIGAGLLPIMTSLVAFLAGTAVPAVTDLGAVFTTATGFVTKHQTAFVTLAAVLGAVLVPALIAAGAQASISAAKTATAWLMAQMAAIRSAAASTAAAARTVAGWVLMGTQSLLQAARMAAAWLIAMGPVGWVIAAVVGLVALVVANWDKVSAWTAKAWSAVSGTVVGNAKKALDWLRRNWPLILALLAGPLGVAVYAIARNWDRITAGAARMKDAVVGKFTDLVGFVKSLPGRIVDALGDLAGTMVGKGEDVVTGIIRGIAGMAGKLRDFVIRFVKDTIPGPVARALGITSPSKVMADKVGRWIPLGVVEGIRATAPQLDREVTRMARVPAVAAGSGVMPPGGQGAGPGAPGWAAGPMAAPGPLVLVEKVELLRGGPRDVADDLMFTLRGKGL